MSKATRITRKIRKLEIKLITAKAPARHFDVIEGNYIVGAPDPTLVAVIEKKIEHLREDLEDAQPDSRWDIDY